MRDFKYYDIKDEFVERIRLLLREMAVDKEQFDFEFCMLDKGIIQKIALEAFHKIFLIVKERKGRVLLQSCKFQQFYYDFTDLKTKSLLAECDIDETREIGKTQAEIINIRKTKLKHEKYLISNKGRRENEAKKLAAKNRGDNSL